jgi:hypothetical protein
LQENFKEKISKQLDKTELNANRLRNRYTVCRATKNCKFKLHFSLETLMDETATAAKKKYCAQQFMNENNCSTESFARCLLVIY